MKYIYIYIYYLNFMLSRQNPNFPLMCCSAVSTGSAGDCGRPVLPSRTSTRSGSSAWCETIALGSTNLMIFTTLKVFQRFFHHFRIISESFPIFSHVDPQLPSSWTGQTDPWTFLCHRPLRWLVLRLQHLGRDQRVVCFQIRNGPPKPSNVSKRGLYIVFKFGEGKWRRRRYW